MNEVYIQDNNEDNDVSIEDIKDMSWVSVVKNYLNIDGLTHLMSLFILFAKNYATPKSYNHNTSYAAKSHMHDDRYYTEFKVDGKLLDKSILGKSNTNLRIGVRRFIPRQWQCNRRNIVLSITV